MKCKFQELHVVWPNWNKGHSGKVAREESAEVGGARWGSFCYHGSAWVSLCSKVELSDWSKLYSVSLGQCLIQTSGMDFRSQFLRLWHSYLCSILVWECLRDASKPKGKESWFRIEQQLRNIWSYTWEQRLLVHLCVGGNQQSSYPKGSFSTIQEFCLSLCLVALIPKSPVLLTMTVSCSVICVLSGSLLPSGHLLNSHPQISPATE